MLHQLVGLAAGAALLFVLGLIIYTALICRVALWRFKIVSKGLPMIGGNIILGNGAISWAVRKNLCTELMGLHRKLGKTLGFVFYTTPVAVTTDLDLIKRIHDEPNKHINRIKTLNVPLHEFENSLMMAQDDAWRKLRRVYAPALKSNKFKTPNVMSEIETSIEKLISYIDLKLDTSNKPEQMPEAGWRVELEDLLQRYSLDLVFSCLYKQPDVIEFNERPCHSTMMVDEGLHALQKSPFVQLGLVFPIICPLLDWAIHRFHPQGQWRRDVMGYIKKLTHLGAVARKEAQEQFAAGMKIDTNNMLLADGTKFRRNMIDHVVDQYIDGKLTKKEYFNTSFFLINAANRPSMDTMVHLLYRLAVHPECQERLRNSIKEHGTESDYVSWFLNESMRLQPSVTIGCSRVITEDMEIESGHVLPKGTFVVTPSFVIHRLREYWGQDADEFKPERWRDTTNHHKYQFIPFGAGPRGCPGKEFALFQIKLLISKLLTKYKIEAQVKEDLYDFDSPFLTIMLSHSPTYVTFKKLQASV